MSNSFVHSPEISSHRSSCRHLLFAILDSLCHHPISPRLDQMQTWFRPELSGVSTGYPPVFHEKKRWVCEWGKELVSRQSIESIVSRFVISFFPPIPTTRPLVPLDPLIIIRSILNCSLEQYKNLLQRLFISKCKREREINYVDEPWAGFNATRCRALKCIKIQTKLSTMNFVVRCVWIILFDIS